MEDSFPGFIEIPTTLLIEKIDVKMAPLPPIAFYAIKRGILVCIREANAAISPLALSQHPTIWVREQDISHLKGAADSVLMDRKLAASVPLKSRMRLVSAAAASATEALLDAPSVETMNRGVQVVGAFVQVLMLDPSTSRFLLRLSAQSPTQVQHAIGTATQCVLLARGVGLESEQELLEIGMAGLLHDIGRTRLPPGISSKSERDCVGLELAQLQKHPQLGYELLQGFPQITERTRRAVLEHHECVDGSGYPFGKKREDLSLASRILSLCNVFQTLTMDTAEKAALTSSQAFEKLRGEYHGKVDPELVKLLAQLFFD